ncbi:MAG TPA: hypothetical protein VN758_14265 [Solirubrobacterales bacterium]|nr:hypothetical protein [Solirubrobacterales bacterium]
MTLDAKAHTISGNQNLIRLALSVFALTIVCLSFLHDAALARTTRAYESSFGSFSGNAHDPQALAVDQSSGDVYVSSALGGQPRVFRFTEAGVPKDFAAGVDAGSNVLTGFTSQGLFKSAKVAVDSSNGPLDGAIYVTNAKSTDAVEGDVVRVFASSGASLGTISGAGTPEGHFSNNVCGVAVDPSSGALYVSETNPSSGTGLGHVWRFAPASPSGSIDDSDYTLSGISVRGPCDLAADSGDLYVVDEGSTDSSLSLHHYSSSSFTTDFDNSSQPTSIELVGSPTAIAVDPQNGDLYVDEGNRVAVFDSAGTPIYTFGAAAYFGVNSRAIAIKGAASGAAARAYVADPQPGSQEVDVFGSLTQAPTFTHPEIASFGPDGSSGSSFSNQGLSGLVFSNATRRLYAVDGEGGTPGIYGFDASAPPAYSLLSGFEPLPIAPSSGLESSLAVDDTALSSSGNLYLASGATDLLYGWDASGSPLGGAFPIDPATNPGPPGGSPKNLCGAGVDSTGDVWVANSSTKRILKYSSAGAALPGTIDTSAQGAPCQLVFDTNDDLYVSISGSGEAQTSGVWRYTAASGYTAATRITAAPTDEPSTNLAVDSSNHHLYVKKYSNSNSTGWVDEYDAAGNLLDEFATGSSYPFGLALDATSHDVYLAERDARKVRVLGPGVLLPEATTRPASVATNTAATLNGLVNDQGLALSDCHFEYVSLAAFRLSGFTDLSSGGSVPCNPAAGSIPLDLDDHQVSATATGLSENTQYRFRLSAANANGTDRTAEVAFSSAGRPLVGTTGSPVRTATTARLEGRVVPSRTATTYHFEYGSEGPCEANPCEATEAHAAGSGDEVELVSQQVEGLQPDTTYHYRVIADNGNPAGLGIGADMTVTTRGSDAPLTHGHFPGPPGSDRAYEQVSIADSGGNPATVATAVSDNGDRAFYRVSGGTPISNTGSFVSPLYAERVETAVHQGSWHSQEIGPPRDQLAGNIWIGPSGRVDLSDQILVNTDSVADGAAIWRLRPGQPAAKIFEPESHGGVGYTVSEDASRVIVSSQKSLDPAHPATAQNMYDVTLGVPHIVGLLPDGSVPACSISGVSLSADGSLAFFGGCGGNLYLREIDTEQTKLIGPGGFIRSVPGAAFFSTTKSLEAGDGGGSDIYRYEIGSEATSCVTCVVSGLNADVGENAVAADGSRVYFKTSAALLPGAATPGVYRVRVADGDLAYVGPGSGVIIGEDPSQGEAITPTGSALVFASSNAGLNAIGGQQNAGTLQYYRYDDRDRSLTCLSCPQDGSAPLTSVERSLLSPGGDLEVGANGTAISADGGTFAFATFTPLLGGDQNTFRPGQAPEVGADVYEWRDGRLLLVTDGLTDWPVNSRPYVSAMTPSGNDIFFIAATQYTQDALDGYSRVYDARIGGGFEFPAPPKPCPLEVCQGTPKGAPEEQAPGSGTFAGPGNAQPRGHHKKKKQRKHAKKKSHKKQSRHAKHDRRAQR